MYKNTTKSKPKATNKMKKVKVSKKKKNSYKK